MRSIKHCATLLVLLLAWATLPAGATNRTHVVSGGAWKIARGTCGQESSGGLPLGPSNSDQAYNLRLFTGGGGPRWPVDTTGMISGFQVSYEHGAGAGVGSVDLCFDLTARADGTGPSCLNGFALRNGSGSLERNSTAAWSTEDLDSDLDVPPSAPGQGWQVPLSGTYTAADGGTGNIDALLSLRAPTPLHQCSESGVSTGHFELILDLVPQ